MNFYNPFLLSIIGKINMNKIFSFLLLLIFPDLYSYSALKFVGRWGKGVFRQKISCVMGVPSSSYSVIYNFAILAAGCLLEELSRFRVVDSFTAGLKTLTSTRNQQVDRKNGRQRKKSKCSFFVVQLQASSIFITVLY